MAVHSLAVCAVVVAAEIRWASVGGDDDEEEEEEPPPHATSDMHSGMSAQ
jgi:hypothetical protein